MRSMQHTVMSSIQRAYGVNEEEKLRVRRHVACEKMGMERKHCKRRAYDHKDFSENTSTNVYTCTPTHIR